MTENYVTRERYQDPEVARSYEGNRFGRMRHRVKNWNTGRVIVRALRHLPPAAEVLDLPCGTGRLITLLQRHGIHWHGGDVSMEMMQVAKEKELDRRFAHGFVRLDAVSLPYADDAFDGVLSIRFIQHIPEALRGRVLAEFHRVSRRWLVIEYKVYNPVLAATKRWRGKSLSYFREADDVRDELTRADFVIREILPVSRIASTSMIYVCENATHGHR